MSIVEDVEKAVEQAMIEYGPDGHIDGAREIAAEALAVCVPHMVLLAGPEERHPLELDPDVSRCSDCGNPWDYCDCPDGDEQRVREAQYKELGALVAAMRRERDSMTEISHHEKTLTSALVDEMHSCAERNHAAAGNARRTVILAGHSIENYEPGSPWHIAEAAILKAAKRIYALETELAESFEDAAKQIAALEGAKLDT